jgi:hypothetical protein
MCLSSATRNLAPLMHTHQAPHDLDIPALEADNADDGPAAVVVVRAAVVQGTVQQNNRAQHIVAHRQEPAFGRVITDVRARLATVVAVRAAAVQGTAQQNNLALRCGGHEYAPRSLRCHRMRRAHALSWG